MGVKRYYRAKYLLENYTQGAGTSYRWVCQNLSKDMGERPYPNPLDTTNCISRYITVSSVVIVGGRQNYSGKITCMWTNLGEPSVGLYTPIFAFAEHPPSVLDDWYKEIHKKKFYCYSGFQDKTINTDECLKIQSYSFKIESREFDNFDNLTRYLLSSQGI
jgi:hypothetical protein